MGLFDFMGAGGGKLSIELASSVVQAGQVLQGRVVFTGGKRSQKITNIKMNFWRSQVVIKPDAQGKPAQSTDQKAVMPESLLTNAFASEPGKRHEFPFQFALPAALDPTSPGAVTYRLSASADIDNEVDPGTSTELTITNPSIPAAQAPQIPTNAGPPPLTVGASVIALWGGDNQWHPGKVVQIHNDLVGVDWDANELGQSTWVPSAQVKLAGGLGAGAGLSSATPSAGGAVGGPAPAPPAPAAPASSGPSLTDQLFGGKGSFMDQVFNAAASATAHPFDVFPNKNPYNLPADVAARYAQGAAPAAAAPAAPAPPPPAAPIGVGSLVLAVWTGDNQWHPGKVVQLAEGLYGVDWDEPALGQSTWVAATHVRAR